MSVPPTYGRYSSLRVFDWATERDEALRFRRAEQPFVLRGVPSLVRAASNWSDDAYLLAAMGADTKFPAEVNEISNHLCVVAPLSGLPSSTELARSHFPALRRRPRSPQHVLEQGQGEEELGVRAADNRGRDHSSRLA